MKEENPALKRIVTWFLLGLALGAILISMADDAISSTNVLLNPTFVITIGTIIFIMLSHIRSKLTLWLGVGAVLGAALILGFPQLDLDTLPPSVLVLWGIAILIGFHV